MKVFVTSMRSVPDATSRYLTMLFLSDGLGKDSGVIVAYPLTIAMRPSFLWIHTDPLGGRVVVVIGSPE